MMENSIKTYGPNPLETREIRSLPECDCFNHTVLDEKSCEVMYRIEALMERLAPMGIDNMRSLWIETVRGDITDWMSYEKWKETYCEGRPSKKKWREEWLWEYPNEVEWYEVNTRQYRILHSLIIYNDRIRSVDFANEEDAYSNEDAKHRYDYSEFLLKLEAYLNAVIRKIESSPNSYNEYIEKNLSYYHRKGQISASAWYSILPDEQRNIKNREETIRVLKSKPVEYAKPMYEHMTLRQYMHIYRIAYDGFYENVDWREKRHPNPSLTDEQVFERCPKGREAFSYDLDTEEGFKAWWNEYSAYHCYDIVYARVHLLPQECRDTGGWEISLGGDGEGYLTGVLGAAVALIKAGIPFDFDTEGYVDFLEGNYTIEIDPLDPRSSIDNPSRNLPYPDEDTSQEQIDRLIAEIRWEKQTEVKLNNKEN